MNVGNQKLQVMQDHLGNKVHLEHLAEIDLLDNLVNQVHKDKLVLQGGKEHLALSVHQMSVARWEHLALLLGMETMDSQVSKVNTVREAKLEHRVNQVLLVNQVILIKQEHQVNKDLKEYLVLQELLVEMDLMDSLVKVVHPENVGRQEHLADW